MDLQMTLNLIAYALVILGVLLAGVRLFAAENEVAGCHYALTFGWLCVIGGLILNIVTLYVSPSCQSLLHEIAYAVILGGVFLSFPAFSCNGSACHRSMIKTGLMSWLSFMVGLILLVVSVYLSVYLQHVLAIIAYAFFIYGLVLMMLKAFKSLFGAVAWFALLAGFILPIIAIYK